MVQLQPMCGEGAAASGSAAAGDPELGSAASVRHKDVVMMSSRSRGRSEASSANYWGHRAGFILGTLSFWTDWKVFRLDSNLKKKCKSFNFKSTNRPHSESSSLQMSALQLESKACRENHTFFSTERKIALS